MTPRHLARALATLLAWLAAALPWLGAGMVLPASAAPYSFTTIDMPGAVDTKLTGINNAGTIVGWTDDGACCGIGFVRAASGSVQTVVVPGSVNISEVYGINQLGQISGSYYDGAKLWGYTRSGAVVTQIDPGAPNDIFAWGLNDSGQVVGSYSLDFGLTTRGFIKSGSAYATLDLGSDGYTAVRGIDASGRVVGSFVDAGIWHGFEMLGATLRQIDVPSLGFTFAHGTNDLGDVVGWWQDASSNGSAFVEHGGVARSFNLPGAEYTIANAINDLGVIVGEWGDARGLVHGFIATPVAEPALGWSLVAGLALLAWARSRRRRPSALACLAAAAALAGAGPVLAFNPQPDPPARLGVVSLGPEQSLRLMVRAVSLVPAVQSDAIPTCRVALAFSDADARPVGPSQIVLLRPGQARTLELRASDVGQTERGQRLLLHPLARLLPPSQSCQGVALSVQQFEPNDRPGWFYASPWLLTPDSAEQ